MLKKHKLALFCLFLLILILGANFALATDRWRPLEVQYPQVPFPGVETPQEFIQKIHDEVSGYAPEQALPLYVKYFYHLFLTISGLIAFGAIVYGGFNYLIAGVSPERTTIAREQITGGILGLIILLSSYLILTTINPQLVIFEIHKPTIAYNSHKECSAGYCLPMPGEGTDECSTNEDCPTETLASTFTEIPIQKLIEWVFIKAEEAKEVAEETQKISENLKKKTEELKLLTDQCNCNNTSPDCTGDCAEDVCDCSSCQNDPCPNRTAINAKRTEINNLSDLLLVWRNRTIEAKIALENELMRLQTAEALMKDCLYQPISYDLMVSIEKIQETEIEKMWDDININHDTATFYCQDEEDIGDLLKMFAENEMRTMEMIERADPGSLVPPPPPSRSGILFGHPTLGCISQWYSSYNPGLYPHTGGCHKGIDYANSRGMPVVAVAAGNVETAVSSCLEGDQACGCGFGNYVVLYHNQEIGDQTYEFYTLYAHLERVLVGIGQEISQGTQIGTIDNTGYSFGDHLHFGFYMKGSLNPSCPTLSGAFDPEPYLSPLPAACVNNTPKNTDHCPSLISFQPPTPDDEECNRCDLALRASSTTIKENAKNDFNNSRYPGVGANCNGSDCWDYVINWARGNGWNPGFILALWGEESGFSRQGAALGCLAPGYGGDIASQLSCLGQIVSNCSGYCQADNSSFCAFMRCYSGGSNCTLSNNPDFYRNLLWFYRQIAADSPSGDCL